MSERFAQGSQETIEYRGRKITLWRTFEDDGRRIRRRWYYRIDQNGPFEVFKTREDALWDAKVRISGELWLLGLRDMFGSQVDVDRLDDLDDLDLDEEELDPTDATTEEAQPEDRRDRLRKKLEMMTVARGCTAEEEASA